MRLYPAIDLKDGNCVRLVQGEMSKAHVFSDSPADQARFFETQGAEYIHIVDLNGAFAGMPVNAAAVQEILGAVSVPIQLGGGIRDIPTIDYWLDAGVSRVILGTLAAKDPDFVRDVARLFGEKIAVGIDARRGLVATEGWAHTTDIQAVDLARRFEDMHIGAIIYTDIERDGAMNGVNVAETASLACSVSIPVIASGGISSLDDLRALRDCQAPIEGVIVGRALYEQKFTLSTAQKLLGTQESPC